MKKCWLFLLALCLALSGCNFRQEQYTATYLDLFDTVTTVIGTAANEAEFRQQTERVYEELQRYHKLFDIYNSYEGINNLKTVNDQAGISPVVVDEAVISLLQDCRDFYDLTNGKVNIAMGSVLQLWHDARAAALQTGEGKLPDAQQLEYAAGHTDIENVVIDTAASTVYLSDPGMSLDVGAVAKGWAVQRVSEGMPAGYLISVGGNVCATGPKFEDGTAWVIGIQHPKKEDSYLHTVPLSGGCMVTSGDYQRTFSVGEKQYHHIIDPKTGLPGTLWCSVTVMCENSALADALSTALFLLPLEEGTALSESCGAKVLWVNGEGEAFCTPGFEELLQNGNKQRIALF